MDTLIMLDTCVFIEYFRSKAKETTLLSKLIRQTRKLYVSAVVKYEVLSGANDNDREQWRQIFDKMTVLAFDDATVDTARMVCRQLKRDNKIIDLGDILIAATAIANDLPLATFNRKHFVRIRGLRLV